MKFKIATFLILDIFVLILAGNLTLGLRYGHPVADFVFSSHLKPFLFLMPFWLLIFYIEGLYTLRNQSRSKMTKSLIRAIILSSVLSIIYFYVFIQFGIAPKTNILIFAIVSFVLLFVFRFLFLKLLNLNAFTERLVLIGNSKLCQELKERINNNKFLGLQVKSIISDEKDIERQVSNINFSKVDRIAVHTDFLDKSSVINKLYQAFPHNVKLMDIIQLMEQVTGEVSVENLKKSWVLENFNTKSYRLNHFIKSCFDKITALIIFVCSLPLIIILCPLLLILNGRPLFFTQTRTGYLNKPFTLVKLRTMRNDAEKDGVKWAQKNDQRITPVGNILRKTRIDEIPQIWNVFMGHMSIVGPRPERPEIIEQLNKKIPFYNERHLVKPGVTGWAQVNFGYASSEEDSLTKLKYDLYYIKYKSLFFDFKILLKTINTIVSGVGR